MTTFAVALKKIQTISPKRLQIVMGLLIAFFVLPQTSTSTYVPVDQDSQEESDAPSSQEQAKVKEAVTFSGSQISFSLQSTLIQGVSLPAIENEKPIFSYLTRPSQKVLKVLFRRIISPNAP